MIETAKEACGGEQVRVIDGLFSESEVSRLYSLLLLAKYRFLHVKEDSKSHWISSADYKLMQAEFGVSNFRSTPAYTSLVSLITKHENLHLERVYSYLTRYGDADYLHRDFFNQDAGISLVYFANPSWENDWGGETLFFDADDDPISAISVKPGRVLIFNGKIPHRAGVPTRACPQVRISLNLRFGLHAPHENKKNKD